MSGTLLKKLSEEDPRQYRNLFRLHQNDFDELLKMLSPNLQKQDTHPKDATSTFEIRKNIEIFGN